MEEILWDGVLEKLIAKSRLIFGVIDILGSEFRMF